MTVVITVPPADLVDAVNRASAVAPKRGSAYDIAGGVLFEWQPPDVLLVKATDLEVTYRSQLKAKANQPIVPTFRVPSIVLSNYLAQLDISEEEMTLTVDVDASQVQIQCGRSKAKLGMIDPDSFPLIDSFLLDDLGEVDDLASRIKMVSWACAQDPPPLSGVHIDGRRLIGCDSHSLAIATCVVPVDKPLTAPLGSITQALRGHRGPMGLAVQGGKLLLTPEADTQFGSTTYPMDYPNIDRLIAMTKDNFVTSVDRSVLLDALNRIKALTGNQPYPRMDIYVEGDEINLEARVPDVGLIQEQVPMLSELENRVVSITFNPNNLANGISHAPNNTIALGWPPTSKGFIRIEDEAGGYLSCMVGIDTGK